MIKTENVKIGKKNFIHTYSDEGKKIKQVKTGAIYDDAYDIKETEYEETDIAAEVI